MDGLGGFCGPLIFGYLLQGTGIWTTNWMFFFVLVAACLFLLTFGVGAWIVTDGLLLLVAKMRGKRVLVFFRGWDKDFEAERTRGVCRELILCALIVSLTHYNISLGILLALRPRCHF